MEDKKKSLQEHFVISQKLMFAGLAVILSALLFPSTVFFWVLWGLGFLIMMTSVLYAAKYLKCPHCGTRLDPRRKVPNFCPNCGKELY